MSQLPNVLQTQEGVLNCMTMLWTYVVGMTLFKEQQKFIANWLNSPSRMEILTEQCKKLISVLTKILIT